MNSLARLFLRDLRYHWKGFASLTAAACLICAVLTGAFLIGDSVRGTLLDNVSANAAFARYRQKFQVPVTAPIRDGLGVLHVKGFTKDGIPLDVYAFPDDRIAGRDAWGSPALAKKLKLEDGAMISVRMQELSEIPPESPMGKPPELKQTPFVWRGEWDDPRVEVSFDDPQLAPCNLFVSHEALAQALSLPENAVNEVWSQEPIHLSDDVLWELSGLYFDTLHGWTILKSRMYYLPAPVVTASRKEDAVRSITLFVESFKDSGGTELSYCFATAFSSNANYLCTPGYSSVGVSPAAAEHYTSPAELTVFTADSFRRIERRKLEIPAGRGAINDLFDDVTGAVCPDIPGLTDSGDCSGWEAAIPIDFDRIRDEDEEYWDKYRNKPKLYLNFEQAQRLVAPLDLKLIDYDASGNALFDGTDSLVTALIFERYVDRHRPEDVREMALNVLRTMPEYNRVEDLMNRTADKVNRGVPFAPLFLGLSFFLIVSGLLVLAMLLKLHIQDREAELALLTDYMPLKRVRRFLLAEFAAVLVPGMFAGLLLGTLLCRFQIFLLEHSWNGIVLMEHIRFHGRMVSYLISFAVSAACAWAVVMLSVRSRHGKPKLSLPHSSCVRPVWRVGALSLVRRCRQYAPCAVLLVLGYLGTLGVGTFGIKSRGEDAFGYSYVATTLLPVVPEYDAPFPSGGLPVRVHAADRADCSNLLLAASPTVYGVDLEALTGDAAFLADGSAAVDEGSLLWIMQKKQHDAVEYANGALTLDRVLKASVFQGGILTGLKTFERLFPDTEGAQFFLIRSESDVKAWRDYLEPFGLELVSTDEFMARAERFQNRYLAIFLQLGLLGFLLGFGALVLLMTRNLRARRDETVLLAETGWSRRMLLMLHLTENLCLFWFSAGVSLLLLLLLAAFASLDLSVLLAGFLFLTAAGTLLIAAIIELHFAPFANKFLGVFPTGCIWSEGRCFHPERTVRSYRTVEKRGRDP